MNRPCPNCGGSEPEDATVCRACGTPMPLPDDIPPGKYAPCPNCGVLESQDSEYCSNCGASLRNGGMRPREPLDEDQLRKLPIPTVTGTEAGDMVLGLVGTAGTICLFGIGLIWVVVANVFFQKYKHLVLGTNIAGIPIIVILGGLFVYFALVIRQF